jgi:hypothetical protein
MENNFEEIRFAAESGPVDCQKGRSTPESSCREETENDGHRRYLTDRPAPPQNEEKMPRWVWPRHDHSHSIDSPSTQAPDSLAHAHDIPKHAPPEPRESA